MPLTSPLYVTFFKAKDNICVVQPDIIVICDSENVDREGKYKGIPSLVVEVVSPSTRCKDMIAKLDLYRQCGVNEYWIVNLKNEHVLVYTLDRNNILDIKTYRKSSEQFVESDYFNGLEVSLDDMFGSKQHNA